ncbi:hypothetical protein [Actinoallomurus sp. NPDC052274]|uniref:hypothetical protein n=1 Tax=Actinoallomurus sp. NPDC052274 TaxID=3155420 RepID=UPI00341A706F
MDEKVQMQVPNKTAGFREKPGRGFAAGICNNALGLLGGGFTKEVTLTVSRPLPGAAVETVAGAFLLMLMAYRDRAADLVFRRGRSTAAPSRSPLTQAMVINIILTGVTIGTTKAMRTVSLVTVSVGVMSTLSMAVPLALYGIEAWRERHRWTAILVPLVTLAGVALITGPQTGDVDLAGAGYALASGAINMLHAVLVGRLLSSGALTQKQADRVGLKAFAWATFLGAVILSACAAFTGGAFGSFLHWRVAAMMIVGAFLFGTLPRMLYAVARRSLSLGSFGLLGATIPLLALLGDMAVYRRLPTASAALGMVTIMFVAAWIAWLKGRAQRSVSNRHGAPAP